MNYELKPCVKDDADFIDEKSNEVSDAIVPPDEDMEEEELVFKIVDAEGNLIAGCIVDEFLSRTCFDTFENMPLFFNSPSRSTSSRRTLFSLLSLNGRREHGF